MIRFRTSGAAVPAGDVASTSNGGQWSEAPQFSAEKKLLQTGRRLDLRA